MSSLCCEANLKKNSVFEAAEILPRTLVYVPCGKTVPNLYQFAVKGVKQKRTLTVVKAENVFASPFGAIFCELVSPLAL